MDANVDPIRLGDGATAPELSGNTLEDKVSSAAGIIGKLFSQAQMLFGQVAGLTKEVNDAKAETARVQGLFDAATKEATDAKAEVTRITGELGEMTKSRDQEKGRADKAETYTGQLESLCGVKGIDPKDAVKAPREGGSAVAQGEALYKQWQELKKESPRKAASFFKANKDAIKAYTDSTASANEQ